MPVRSYLVHPREGRRDSLLLELQGMLGCTAIAARQRELLILVTDAPTEERSGELEAAVVRLTDVRALEAADSFAGALQQLERAEREVVTA